MSDDEYWSDEAYDDDEDEDDEWNEDEWADQDDGGMEPIAMQRTNHLPLYAAHPYPLTHAQAYAAASLHASSSAALGSFPSSIPSHWSQLPAPLAVSYPMTPWQWCSSAAPWLLERLSQLEEQRQQMMRTEVAPSRLELVRRHMEREQAADTATVSASHPHPPTTPHTHSSAQLVTQAASSAAVVSCSSSDDDGVGEALVHVAAADPQLQQAAPALPSHPSASSTTTALRRTRARADDSHSRHRSSRKRKKHEHAC